MKTTLATIGLLACSLALGACGSTAKHVYTYDVPIGKPIAVDIQNTRGDVVVRGDSDSDQIRVTASRWISDKNIEGEETRAHFDDHWNPEDVVIEVVEQEGGTVLTIRPGAHNNDLGVFLDLFIEMPSLDGVNIRNAHGPVVLVEAAGVMRVHNQHGAIDVRTSRPLSEEVTLTTTEGNIYLQVPAESAGKVDMLTLDGIVSFKDRVVGSSGTHTPDSRSLTAFMGASDNQLLFRTDEGNIYLWIMEDPLAYTRTIRPILKHPKGYLFLKGSRRHTRNLPESHPEILNYQDPDESGY